MNARKFLMLRRSGAVLGLLAGLLAGALSGCAPKQRPGTSLFSGKVTLGGAPFGPVAMRLHYTSGATYMVVVGSDGTFSVSDVPTGTAKVTFEISSPMDTMAKFKMPPEAKQAMEEKMKEKIPAGAGKNMFGSGGGKVPQQYTDPATTPESVTITEGTTIQNFDLKE
jgi:hypothetical protein